MLDKKGLTEEEFLKQYDDSKYPKPSLTADNIIFYKNKVLLIKRGGHPFIGKWAFPGGFANKNEPLEMTAKRELEEETGLTDIPSSLLNIYSTPGRDPRGWVVSAAYLSIIDDEKEVKGLDDAADAKWFEINDQKLVSDDINITFDDLAFDHAQILKEALNKIKTTQS